MYIHVIGIGSCGYGGWEVPLPVVCSWRTRTAVDIIQVQKPENREADGLSPSLSLRNRNAHVQEEGCLSSRRESKLALLLPFCSLQALGGWEDAHPCWWKLPSLLTLWTQMLVSSGDARTDTLRNSALLAVWESLGPVRLTHRINHHRDWCKQPKCWPVSLHH